MNNTIVIPDGQIGDCRKSINGVVLIHVIFNYQLPISLPLKTDVIFNGIKQCITIV